MFIVKLMFKPVSILGGVLAGLLARRSFALIWRAVDDREAPQPEQRSVSLPKLALALSLQGAVFTLVRGLVDHLSRRGFAKATGRWPGVDRPCDDGAPNDA
jgi:hypothetical protein